MFRQQEIRSFTLSFCITCLLLGLMIGILIAFQQTAGVMEQTDTVFTVSHSKKSIEITLFDEKKQIDTEKADEAVQEYLRFSPLIPRGLRFAADLAAAVAYGAEYGSDWLGQLFSVPSGTDSMTPS